ncbi:MAG: DUF3127 domain-containing protein [Flavobacteriales bacterium]|jgi:hypothetical protein
MELSGTIKQFFEEKKFPSGFSLREFVITTEDRYPQEIILQFNGEKTSVLEGYRTGEKVKVTFDIRGRESNGRYYNSLVAWKIEREGATAQPAGYASNAPSAPTSAPTPPPPPPMSDEDDLPF